MLWLYILAVFIILFGAAVVINRRRRRSVSYESQSAARLDHARNGQYCGNSPEVNESGGG